MTGKWETEIMCCRNKPIRLCVHVINPDLENSRWQLADASDSFRTLSTLHSLPNYTVINR